jgi:predicted porin
MKKTAIALACASTLAATFAAAQGSNPVTLYGRMNVSFENIKPEGGASRNTVQDNGSRLGVRGKEDLGGGLSAIFQIESRVRADQGGTGLATRDSWVGLQGGFGTFKIGRLTSPTYFATADYISMHNHDTGTTADALFYALGAFGDVRNNNALYYSLPSMNGFTVETSYSVLSEGSNRPRFLDVAVSYDKGPLHIGAGYVETRKYNGSVFVANVDKANAIVGAFSYNFGGFVLGALAQRDKHTALAGAAGSLPAGSYKRTSFRISGMVPVGQHEFHANIGRAGKIGGISNTEATQWTLAYNYNLSKRTKAFLQIGEIENKTAAPYTLAGTNAAGRDERTVGGGIRHNF